MPAVGEPLNAEAWEWYYRVVGEGQCTLVDTWWQTGGCGGRQVGVVADECGVVADRWVWRQTGVVWRQTGGCGGRQVGVVADRWVWWQTGGCGSRQVGVVDGGLRPTSFSVLPRK